jgi:uncharacterized protein (DUF2225 family)
MYRVLSGQVGLYHNGQQPEGTPAAILEAGACFGEGALLFGQTCSDTAVALSDTALLAISLSTLEQFCREDPATVIDLIKALRAPTYAAYSQPTGHDEPAPEPAFAAEPAVPATEVAAPEPVSPAIAEAKTSPPADESPDVWTTDCAALPSLFPAGHQLYHYQLPVEQVDTKYIYERAAICPVCGQSFKTCALRHSRLVVERMDTNLRNRYKGVEPMYYDVVTCPKCWYSALDDVFKTAAAANRKREAIDEMMLPYKAEMGLNFGLTRDTMTIFAGYYLALRCLPVCFAGQPLLSGKLWMKLSHLYADCHDENMRHYAARKALAAYQSAYETAHVPPKQVQQLCYIIGELSRQFHDATTARRYLFLAKTEKEGSQVIRRYAEDRLEDIKAAEAAKREQAALQQDSPG